MIINSTLIEGSQYYNENITFEKSNKSIITGDQTSAIKFPTNLVIVGDLIREIVAREVTLKISDKLSSR